MKVDKCKTYSRLGFNPQPAAIFYFSFVILTIKISEGVVPSSICRYTRSLLVIAILYMHLELSWHLETFSMLLMRRLSSLSTGLMMAVSMFFLVTLRQGYCSFTRRKISWVTCGVNFIDITSSKYYVHWMILLSSYALNNIVAVWNIIQCFYEKINIAI